MLTIQVAGKKIVLDNEIKDEFTVAWLRNLPNKAWSFCIPYEKAGSVTPMFPDFLIIRKNGDDLITDILEPHDSTRTDNVGKVVGLAKFAEKHGDQFGRIQLIRIENNKHIKRLDVNDPAIQRKVKAVNSNEHLDQLFEDV